MNDSLHTNTVTSNFEKELMSVFSNCPLCFSCCVSVDILPVYAFVFSLEQPQGRCKSMESLLIQEQNKSSAVFHAADDSSSESNTSEMSRHRDEEAHSPRKQHTFTDARATERKDFGFCRITSTIVEYAPEHDSCAVSAYTRRL